MRRIGLIAALVACITVTTDAMTKAQMQTLATAITNAGYQTHLIPLPGGSEWNVRGLSPEIDVPIATVNNLAVAQGLSAFVSFVEFGPMDTAKMQAVVTAVTNAGYGAVAVQVAAGSWKVRATSGTLDIPTASVQALATAQAVPALVSMVEYR